MKNKVSILGWTLAAVVLLLLPVRSLADTADISVVSPAAVSVGDSFAVDVNIANVTDLYDFQLDLTFDPAVLQATGILEGAFLSSGGDTFFLPGFIDNTAGSIIFNANTLLSATPGVSGAGNLLEFEFLAQSAGTSSLNLSNVILGDSLGSEISSSLTGSSVTVSGTGPIPTPEPSPLILLLAAISSVALVSRFKRAL